MREGKGICTKNKSDKNSNKGTKSIRIIKADALTSAVRDLCIRTNVRLRDDIRCALESSCAKETNPLSKFALQKLLQNADIAHNKQMPVCQDTGMAVVYVKIGQAVHIDGDVDWAINKGVRLGYRDGYLRASIVCDPIDRVNTEDNTPAVIHYSFVAGDTVEIIFAPKGFGSENMGAVSMLTPSAGLNGIEDFVVQVIKKAGANPCPPIVVGVGVGGTMEKCVLLAKEALLQDIGGGNPDPMWHDVEKRLLQRINALGIGAAGFGGDTTALAVHIKTYPTHIAGLPVAVCINCNVARHESVII